MNEKQQKVLVAVATLVGQGYAEDFENLAKKLKSEKDKATLPKELQEIYEEVVGNTPNEEPEVYELSKEIETQEKSIMDLIVKYMPGETEDEKLDAVDKYSIEDVSFLAGEIIRKVTSKKDKDGVYKQTPATTGWERPKPSSIKKYQNHIKCFPNPEKATLEELESANEEFEKFLLEACKMQDKTFTPWEKALVLEQTSDAIKGFTNSFLGKR
jgi:hypothetical protein